MSLSAIGVLPPAALDAESSTNGSSGVPSSKVPEVVTMTGPAQRESIAWLQWLHWSEWIVMPLLLALNGYYWTRVREHFT